MGLVLAFVTTAAGKAWRALREGRLPASPARWLRDLTLHWGEIAEHGAPERAKRTPTPLASARQQLAGEASRELDRLLERGERLAWPHHEAPRVSVLLVLHNRAELTLRALRSLPALPLEVVVVDNASTDRTAQLLERLDGPRVLCNATNLGFLAAVNQAARLARGEHLLLLNSDAQLLPGSLEAALETLADGPDVGAVGARLVLPDGALQEAGGIIWRDGWCEGYGRGHSPDDAAFDFARDVDFCSGACLLVRRDAFEALGGLDARYAPAYYEDADLCVRLWRSGRRVVYDPRMVARHVEFASARSPGDALALQREQHGRFVTIQGDWLARQPERAAGVVAASRRRPRGLRLLFVDDRLPVSRFGSGHPRAAQMVRALAAAGHAVTVHATAFPSPYDRVRDALPLTVEVLDGGEGQALERMLRERLPLVDRILVSRPENLRRLRRALLALGRWPSPVPIIYDAEAIHALRQHDPAGPALVEELALARDAHTVLAVSEAERATLAAAGARRVLRLGHALEPVGSDAAFDARSGVLFVGAFYQPDSPNSDAAVWLVEDIWPLVRARLPGARLTIAGPRPGRRLRALAAPDVAVLGAVDDLTPLYDGARVFVAPTRFAAGLPHKIQEAAAHGLPVVATALLAAQLTWQAGLELSVADAPEAFAAAVIRLHQDAAAWHDQRQRALERVALDCAPAAFAATLAEALR